MSSLEEVGAQFVASTPLRFSKFKGDIERVQTAVHRKMMAGQTDEDLARELHFDRRHSISAPLQQRYLAEGAFEPLIEWHRKRPLFQLPGWPDEIAGEALDGLAEGGRPADAVALAREHFDGRLKRMRKHVQMRYRRGPRRPMDEEMKGAVDSLSQAIVDDMPAEKAEMLRDLERLEPMIRAHGGPDDVGWLDALRAEIWKERRA